MNRKTTLSVILLVFLMFAGQALADGNLESAQKYFDAGEFKKAVGLLKEVTKEDPSNTKAWILLGNSYTGLEKNKNAIKAYERALRIDSENEEAFFGLGINYSRMRNHSNAIEVFKKVIGINPKHAEAHFELGVSYDRTNHLTYAFEQYKILKTLDESLADKLYHIILGS